MSIPKKKSKYGSTWRPLSKDEKEVAKEVKKKQVRNLKDSPSYKPKFKDVPATQKIKQTIKRRR